MPLPVITGVYRVAFNWITPTMSAHNVIHVNDSSESRDAASVGDAVKGALTAHGAAMFEWQTADAELVSLDVTPLDGTSATFNEAIGVGFGAGDSDFYVAPCPVYSFHTATRGRSARGRFYMPFLQLGSADSGRLVGAGIADTLAGWAAFHAALEALTPDLEPVVASYKLGEAFGILSVSLKPHLGTQRRRQRRLGP
jgi:hypothetical protein